MSERCIAVALPLPFQATFTYRLPEGTAEVARGAGDGLMKQRETNRRKLADTEKRDAS